MMRFLDFCECYKFRGELVSSRINNLIIVFISFVFYSCGNLDLKKNDKSVTEEKIFYTAPNTDIEKILNDYTSKVKEHSNRDSLFYPFGNRVMEEDSSRILVIGKFVDAERIFAVSISSSENATINFYHLEYDKWKIIGTHKTSNDIFRVEFKDYDGDNRNEIITIGHPNMNGNYWNNFYYPSIQKDTIKYAGGFYSGIYNKSEYDNKLEVSYYGSWYMDNEQTLYRWKNEKLILLKKVIKGLKIKDMKHNSEFIEYYENPTSDKDTLVLKFRKTYRERIKKLYNLWENFFNSKLEN